MAMDSSDNDPAKALYHARESYKIRDRIGAFESDFGRGKYQEWITYLREAVERAIKKRHWWKFWGR